MTDPEKPTSTWYEPEEPGRGTVLTIKVMLPAPISKVVRLLDHVIAHWPDCTIDLNGPEGWIIELHEKEEAADDGKDRG